MTKKNAPIKICPSILAGDFAHIADEAKRIEDSGADCLHVDVMDGLFVPNLTIGPQVVAAINRSTDMFLDVHLMIYNPFDFIERFVEAGADMITIHFEATEDVEDVLEFIRKCNVKAGLSFRPETSMTMIPRFLTMCDMILIMTVNPGFGGQEFMTDTVEKVRFTRYVCNTLNIREGGIIVEKEKVKDYAPFQIEVDGGINLETAKLCSEAGATNFVAGTYLMSQTDMKSSVSQMRSVCQNNFLEDVNFSHEKE